jgi:aryl-alcohol dehydrogenase-like predicted oxidoreductase
VFPLSLGCMGMSGTYGPSDEHESVATIHAALEAGITLIDTGDFYGMGHNEMLIGRALKGRREQALLSVKFGALRGPDGSWVGYDARPAAVKNLLAVPIEETIGAIADLVHAGYVRAIGLSEVGPDTIRGAHAVHPIVDLQIEYSLVSRAPRRGSFRCSPSLASASPPTASCRAGCSRARPSPPRAISERDSRGLVPTTARGTPVSWRRGLSCRWHPLRRAPDAHARQRAVIR